MREQLIEQGVDDLSLDFILEDMRDSGMFDAGTVNHER